MTETQIVDQALENLQTTTLLRGTWSQNGHGPLDGTLQLVAEEKVWNFNVEIKNELRPQFMPQLLQYNQVHTPFLLVAYRIPAKINEELRKNNIAYLEANGNLYLKEPDVWFWFDTQEPLKIQQNERNRAFTKTGLKVVFEFLINPSLLNLPSRQIAEQTGTSIGNVTHIMNGLKKDKFLLSLTGNTYQLVQKQDLMNKWIAAYEQVLKPSLHVGTFRFLNEDDFTNWKNLKLLAKTTRWGGEPAGDLLTHHLRPAELTLYTTETRMELMRNYRLLPTDNGNVKVYQAFRPLENTDDALQVVHPMLVYADLMIQNDKRCRETAQMIYEKYLQ